MWHSLRSKLLTIIGIPSLGFLLLMATGSYLTDRMEQNLSKIQEQYIPIIEHGPRLESTFDHLTRAMQDSVAAQDLDALDKTKLVRDEFISQISLLGKSIKSEDAAKLQDAVEEYYAAAYMASRRLIGQETGLAIVEIMKLMQVKKSEAETLLRRLVTLDQNSLLTAFSTISKTQRTSGDVLIFVSLTCLLIVIILSIGLIRGILSSLLSLSNGLTRFGLGDFSSPIIIHGSTELTAVARQANQMADRIKGLMKELEGFSYSVAHDLRTPLRSILGFSQAIIEDHGAELPEEVTSLLSRVMSSTRRMGDLIDSLLNLSRMARKEVKKEVVNLSAAAQMILDELVQTNPDRKVTITVEKEMVEKGDNQLLGIVLTNLLGNAWKFTSKKEEAKIEFGAITKKNCKTYFVRDNGAGFDMRFKEKLFGTLQRLHSNNEFEGNGIGLATVQGILRRHGGEIWAESKVGEGTAFYFTLWHKATEQEANERSKSFTD